MTEETNLLVYYNVLNYALRPDNFYSKLLHDIAKVFVPNEILPSKIYVFNKSLFNYDKCGHDIMIDYYDIVYKFAETNIDKYFDPGNDAIDQKIKGLKQKLKDEKNNAYYDLPQVITPMLNIDTLFCKHKTIGVIKPETDDKYYVINAIYDIIYKTYLEILSSRNSYSLYDIINFSWLFRQYFFGNKKITDENKVVDILDALPATVVPAPGIPGAVPIAGAVPAPGIPGPGAGVGVPDPSISKLYVETWKFLIGMLGYIKYISYSNNININPTTSTLEQLLKKHFVPYLTPPEVFISYKNDTIKVIDPNEEKKKSKDFFEQYCNIYEMFHSKKVEYNNQSYLYNLAVNFTDITISLYKIDIVVISYIKDKFIEPFLKAIGTVIDDISPITHPIPGTVDVAQRLQLILKDYFVDPEYLWYSGIDVIDDINKISFIPSLDVTFLEIESSKEKIKDFISQIAVKLEYRTGFDQNMSLKTEVFIDLLKDLSAKPALLALMQKLFEKCNISRKLIRNAEYKANVRIKKISGIPDSKLSYSITKNGLKVKTITDWIYPISKCGEYIVPLDIEDYIEDMASREFITKYRKIMSDFVDNNWWCNFLLRNIKAEPSSEYLDYIGKTPNYIEKYGGIAPLPSVDEETGRVINENPWFPSISNNDLIMATNYNIGRDSWYDAIISSLAGIKVQDTDYVNLFADETLTRQDIIHNLRQEIADELSKTTSWPNGLSFMEVILNEIMAELRDKDKDKDNDKAESDFFSFILDHSRYIYSENITDKDISVLDSLWSSIVKPLKLNYTIATPDKYAPFIIDIYVNLSNKKSRIEWNLFERCMTELYLAYIRKGGRGYIGIETQLLANRYEIDIVGYSYLRTPDTGNVSIKHTHLFKSMASKNSNRLTIAILQEDIPNGHYSAVISKSYQAMFNNTCVNERKKIDKKYDFDSIPENIYLLQGIIESITKNSHIYSIYSDFIQASGIKPYVLDVIKNIGKIDNAVADGDDLGDDLGDDGVDLGDSKIKVLRQKDRFKSMKKILKLLKIYYILFEDHAQSLVECYRCIINRLIACYSDYSAETLTKVKKILCIMSIDDMSMSKSKSSNIPIDFFEAGHESIYKLLATNFTIDKKNASEENAKLFDEIILLPIPSRAGAGQQQYSKSGAFTGISLTPTFSRFDKFIEIIDTQYEKDEVDGGYRAIIEEYCRANYEDIKQSIALDGNNCKEMILQTATEEVLKTLLPSINGMGENEMDLDWLGIPDLTPASYYICYAVLHTNHMYFSGDDENIKASFAELHKMILSECGHNDSDDFIKQTALKYMNNIRALLN